jgi:hypothetical protein
MNRACFTNANLHENNHMRAASDLFKINYLRIKKKFFILTVALSFISFYVARAQEAHSAISITATDNVTVVPLRINDNLSSPYGRHIHLSRGNDLHFFNIGLDPWYNNFCISRKNNNDLTLPAFSISDVGVGIGSWAYPARFPLEVSGATDVCVDGYYTSAKIGTMESLYFIQDLAHDPYGTGIGFNAYLDNNDANWKLGGVYTPASLLFFDDNGTFSYSIAGNSGYQGNPITSWTKPFVINNQGKVGIGTGDTALTEKLEVVGTVKATKFILRNGTVLDGGQWTTTGSNIYFNTGNILIGKTTQTNTNYKLDVTGKVRANEVTVNTTGADFVFEKSYKLRPLSEVESFIKANKRLPDIAPASTMQTNGVSVGEMQANLLQKVEELTLYSIEQEKKNAILEQDLIEQKAKYDKLLQKVEALTRLIEKK